MTPRQKTSALLQEGNQGEVPQSASPVTDQSPGSACDPLQVKDGPGTTSTAPFHATPALLIFKALLVDDKVPPKLISIPTSSPDDGDPSSLIVVSLLK